MSSKRSKSQPPHLGKADVEMIHDEIKDDSHKPKKMSKKKKNVMKSTIDNRPPFNLDTHIDGYDDVDDKGRIRRRWEPEAKNKTDQEQLNREWLKSLRGGLHE